MSLILDALKKLERDKEAAEPDVVVVGAVPWQGVRRGRGRVLVAFGALAAVALAATVWWLARPTSPSTAQRPSSGAAAAPGGGERESQGLPATSSVARKPEAPLSALASRQLAVPEAPSKPPAKPTMPGAAAATPATRADLQLNAISQRDGHAVALIGGRLVHEGDRFDGIRVLRIRETEVEVEVNGHRRLLRF